MRKQRTDHDPIANRRVSFAPEATLHTWDVIEYMRDANTTTSSSSSSNNSLNSSVRRSPSASPQRIPESPSKSAAIDPTDPPSTPPEQVEEQLPGESPASQREMHQKKRRRRSSSGIPPMNFNNPEDFSSSPLSGSSSPGGPSPGGESIGSDSDSLDSDDDVDEDQTTTAMSLDMDLDEATAQSIASNTSNSSTGSSARLDEALRQAARQAGTQALELEDNGEMSMEMAADEVTAAFKPWIRHAASAKAPEDSALDKENVDPFSPSRNAPIARFTQSQLNPSSSSTDDADISMDISMDITRAVGGIVPFSSSSERNTSSDTMDLTMVMPGSGILTGASAMDPQNRRGSLKRRRSSAITTAADETGSPAKKPATGRRQSIRASRRRSSLAAAAAEDEAGVDAAMDLTATLGAIQEDPSQQLLQEALHREKVESKARDSIDTTETSFEEAPMDMTVMLGAGIIPAAKESDAIEEDTNEDLSMEFTTAIGKIQSKPAITETKIATPEQAPAKAQRQDWAFPAAQNESSPAKPTTPATPKQPTPNKAVPGNKIASPVKSTPQRSPLKSSRRKSIMPITPEAQGPATPQRQSAKPAPGGAKRPATPRIGKSPLSKELKLPEPAPPTIVTPIRIPEVQPKPTLPQPSPSPKQTQSDTLPPAVRSPLAPKANEAVNQLPQSGLPKLSDSLKQLSTPRKQISDSPLKKIVAASTPRIAKSLTKTSSPVKRKTPKKSVSPKKVVRLALDSTPPGLKVTDGAVAVPQNEQPEDDQPRIALQDFLNMTGIQFLDLTTTKRRHTGFPSLSKSALLDEEEDESAGGDGLDSLERTVTTATTLLPELSMYQHSCHEMKSYLSTGKEVVRTIEAEVSEDQPPLFLEYASAPPKERHIMDDQFRAMKTNARLESKGTWYQWRSQLLRDLAGGLDETEAGMKSDQKALTKLEEELQHTMSALMEKKQSLESEAVALRRRKEERESGEREELDGARSRLVDVDALMQEKRQFLEEMRMKAQHTEGVIEAANERKEECLAAINEAERIKEECRGWSADEVSTLRAETKLLESTHHWSVVSATSDPSTMTLSYRNEIELFFHPFSFQDARSPMSSPSKAAHSNMPISLIYNPKAVLKQSAEPNTMQRFFLQLLRAHLLGLPQCSTPISTLLKLVSQGWDKCRTMNEAVRQLDMLGMTDVAILGDEQIRIAAAILLPQVDSKVQIMFDVGVGLMHNLQGDNDVGVGAKFTSSAKAVYGERYDEDKMGEFLKTFCGEQVGGFESAAGWADAVDDLRRRLIKRGRKT